MNGFYPMLNEVHDKAVKELPLAECALFEHIWRKLIGWNKFEDEISISQLVKETSACRATVITLLNNLEAKRWIIVNRQTSNTRRKFTNKIALPRCPGIESRLGWSNIYTRAGIESVPGGSLESRHTTDSSFTDTSTDISPIDQKIDPPKKVSPKSGVSDMVNIQRALLEKWGIFSVSDASVLKMLSELTISRGAEGQDPVTREKTIVPPTYAPLEFWFDMINNMDDAPAHGVNSIIVYGKTAWNDWARRHKITIF